MTEILPNLFLGDLNDSINNKYETVFSMCPTPLLYNKSFHYRYPIEDNPTQNIIQYFDEITNNIYHHLLCDKNKKILVHCAVGRSRSATIIIAFLMRYEQYNLHTAYQYVLLKRPIIQPNIGFLKQLSQYEQILLEQDRLNNRFSIAI